MFQAIIEDRNAPKVEKAIDGYSGFLFYDDNGMLLVAMHWQHRFNHMVSRYNDKFLWFKCTPSLCYMLLSFVKISDFEGKLAL